MGRHHRWWGYISEMGRHPEFGYLQGGILGDAINHSSFRYDSSFLDCNILVYGSEMIISRMKRSNVQIFLLQIERYGDETTMDWSQSLIFLKFSWIFSHIKSVLNSKYLTANKIRHAHFIQNAQPEYQNPISDG